MNHDQGNICGDVYTEGVKFQVLRQEQIDGERDESAACCDNFTHSAFAARNCYACGQPYHLYIHRIDCPVPNFYYV